jgi:hypothetical protein
MPGSWPGPAFARAPRCPRSLCVRLLAARRCAAPPISSVRPPTPPPPTPTHPLLSLSLSPAAAPHLQVVADIGYSVAVKAGSTGADIYKSVFANVSGTAVIM